MKRRGFLKYLGAGAAVTCVLPTLLVSNIEDLYDTPLSDIPEFPGKNGESFHVSFNKKFETGDILTYDPEYGEQLMVVSSRDFPEHEVRLVTNDKQHYFPKHNLAKGVEYFKISHYYVGEYGTNISGAFPSEKAITTYII